MSHIKLSIAGAIFCLTSLYGEGQIDVNNTASVITPAQEHNISKTDVLSTPSTSIHAGQQDPTAYPPMDVNFITTPEEIDAKRKELLKAMMDEKRTACQPFFLHEKKESTDSYIKASLIKLGLKCGLFGPVLDDDSELGQESLTNEDLNEIFLSFMVEKERKLEEERRLEKEKKALEKSGGNPHVPGRVRLQTASGTPIYPRNPNNPLVVGSNKDGFVEKAKIVPVAEVEPEPEPVELKEVMIVGIICDDGKCTAYTSAGSLTIGSIIGDTEEKVLAVKSGGIKTDQRWISFD